MEALRQRETYTAYFNTDHEWVGNEYANAYGSGSYFRVDVTDDTGAITHQLESGKEFNAGGELVRDWAFKFDPLTGDMLGGSETMDGRTIEYGANWDRLSESFRGNQRKPDAGRAQGHSPVGVATVTT